MGMFFTDNYVCDKLNHQAKALFRSKNSIEKKLTKLKSKYIEISTFTDALITPHLTLFKVHSYEKDVLVQENHLQEILDGLSVILARLNEAKINTKQHKEEKIVKLINTIECQISKAEIMLQESKDMRETFHDRIRTDLNIKFDKTLKLIYKYLAGKKYVYKDEVIVAFKSTKLYFEMYFELLPSMPTLKTDPFLLVKNYSILIDLQSLDAHKRFKSVEKYLQTEELTGNNKNAAYTVLSNWNQRLKDTNSACTITTDKLCDIRNLALVISATTQPDTNVNKYYVQLYSADGFNEYLKSGHSHDLDPQTRAKIVAIDIGTKEDFEHRYSVLENTIDVIGLKHRF